MDVWRLGRWLSNNAFLPIVEVPFRNGAWVAPSAGRDAGSGIGTLVMPVLECCFFDSCQLQGTVHRREFRHKGPL